MNFSFTSVAKTNWILSLSILFLIILPIVEPIGAGPEIKDQNSYSDDLSIKFDEINNYEPGPSATNPLYTIVINEILANALNEDTG